MVVAPLLEAIVLAITLSYATTTKFGKCHIETINLKKKKIPVLELVVVAEGRSLHSFVASFVDSNYSSY